MNQVLLKLVNLAMELEEIEERDILGLISVLEREKFRFETKEQQVNVEVNGENVCLYEQSVYTQPLWGMIDGLNNSKKDAV